MKRYKLLKDLPTFKAGEEFYINESGKLISVNRRPLVAYARGTLKKYPNILKDWFEEIKEVEEVVRGKAKVGETYWWLNSSYGTVHKDQERLDWVDNYRYKIGNYFKTEKEAEKYGEYLEALQIIKDDAKGFKSDWKDCDQIKYYAYYDYDEGCLDWCETRFVKFQGVIYFKTKEDLKESFEKHRKEWLTVLGVEETDEKN